MAGAARRWRWSASRSLVAGERLMATRFTGDRGYAVTFRNVDRWSRWTSPIPLTRRRWPS